MKKHILTGFGFGPIQGGLFVKEAFESGGFERIVVAEVDQTLVDAAGANRNSYFLNVALSDGIEAVEIKNVELFNPNVTRDRRVLVEALKNSTEVVTSLPSVASYEMGGNASVVSLLAEGLRSANAGATIVYTAENNNRAAEVLEECVTRASSASLGRPVQFLNTVIGKMSRVVRDGAEIAELGLAPIAPGVDRAFLVESFNHILVSRTRLEGLSPAIEVFEEKEDLLPFEEAKLYGHNAVHALIGYLAEEKGYRMMAEAGSDEDLAGLARDAFLLESGEALTARHGGVDPLFTQDGYRTYAEDLLSRMFNPYLGDSVERVIRDPRRKLGWDDRLVGTMRIAIEAGITPGRFAMGARAALRLLAGERPGDTPEDILREIWADVPESTELRAIVDLINSP